MDLHFFKWHGNYFYWRRTKTRNYQMCLAFANGVRATAWRAVPRKRLETLYKQVISTNSVNQYC